MNDVRGEVPLTGRETEIMVLLRSGMNRSEVASCLAIAYPTVRTHMRSVFGKLGVRTVGGALHVLDERRKKQLAREIREAAARYWGHEKTSLEETKERITALLVSFINDPEVTQAIKEWEES